MYAETAGLRTRESEEKRQRKVWCGVVWCGVGWKRGVAWR